MTHRSFGDRRNEVRRLRRAIRDLHGCRSVHRETFLVREEFHDRPAWEGTVEVFELIGHPQAKLAYAWNQKTDGGNTKCVTVLGVDPIRSAMDAVSAAVQMTLLDAHRRPASAAVSVARWGAGSR